MSIISAGTTNSTSILVTGDTTGNLVLRTNTASTALTLDLNQDATFANNVTVTGVLNANVSGNGATLTNINASNITSGTINNAYTTANAASLANTIVLRDANASFATNVVTATDISTTNVSATTGSFTNVSGNGAAISGINASNVTSGTLDNARTSASSSNGASTIVLRDSNGSFAANAVTTNSISGNGVALTAINASNVTSGTLDNARTSAASANGASTIVARDSDGSFAANVITTNSISGNGSALTGINASNISAGTIANARTTADTANGASTIVLRGTSGEFSAGAITAVSISGNGAALTAINASNISSGTIDNARTTAASANGASTIVARDSNGSFTANAGTFTTLSGNLTGNVTLTTGTISTSASNATDIVNKAYVDNAVAAGVHFHAPVRVESPTPLNATYNNGTAGVGATLTNAGTQAALVIDGVTLSVNDRVLIYTQTNQVQNGVYTVTNVGSGSTNWVLTRATDADSYVNDSPDGLSEGSTFFVQQGDTGAGETYTCNTQGTITFGTTNITFAQISSAQIYSAGTGLTLSGTQFSLSNTAVTAATYGNAGAVATFTVNAQGQITAASNAAINASSITLGTLANARTTASDANGASTIVARDTNGSFSANVVTATTGSFTSISGNGVALTAINASNISSGTIANARTTASSSNGASTIVLRDANGDFAADAITANFFIGDGSNVSAMNATNLSSGTVNSARISGSYTGITGVGTLTAGTWQGNSISTTYTDAKVTSITGTANQITASASTGAITLSTPQSIGTSSSVQFGSFGVGTAASGTTGEIRATNNVTAYYSSDERLKDNVKVIANALDKTMQIRGVEFDWNNLKEEEDGYFVRKHDVGVIAQEIEKVLPEVVATRDDGTKAVKYDRIIPLLIEAIKELKAEVDALKGR